jgi:hypothetical protein
MRFAALALALMIALGLAYGYPLQGSNGAVNCTIFGIFKEPFTPGNAHADKDVVLNVDLGLTRANASNNSTVKAVYILMDGNDRIYNNRPEYTRDFQPSRWLIGFVVPKETIAKSLMVDPSADPSCGEQFAVPFVETANASNGKVSLHYYGIVGSKVESNRKSIEFDIGILNNDTSRLLLSWKNFSLIDQWGWKYGSMAYNKYNGEGFPAVELHPNETLRSRLLFDAISPLSRPVKLAYEYNNTSNIIIDIDPEGGLRSSASSAQESDACCNQSQAEAPPTNLAGSIKATKARLAKVRENLNSSA